jgi:hypothetical protein
MAKKLLVSRNDFVKIVSSVQLLSKRISNQADDVRETTHLHHCREESPLVNIRFDNGTGPIKS